MNVKDEFSAARSLIAANTSEEVRINVRAETIILAGSQAARNSDAGVVSAAEFGHTTPPLELTATSVQFIMQESDELCAKVLYEAFTEDSEVYYLSWVFVAEMWRGNGIGRALVENSVSAMREEGAEKIYAKIENTRATSLLIDAGFKTSSIGKPTEEWYCLSVV